MIVLSAFLLGACGSGGGASLEAVDFQDKLKEYSHATLLDVRTPQEYAEGHLENAVLAPVGSGSFESEVSKLDKSNPVFVYCLSGGRSASAASQLKSMGFTQIHDLSGGLMNWRMAGLPLAQSGEEISEGGGMNLKDFSAELKDERLVLVDFYAEWCAPCKQMEPFIEEISQDMAAKVKVVRIDADANPDLMMQLGIDALPTIHVYKQNELSWRHVGFIVKEGLLEKLK